MAYINFASDEQMGKFHELVDMFESGEIDKGTFLYEASTLIGDISVSGYESGFKAVWDCHEVWKKEKSQQSYDEGFDAGHEYYEENHAYRVHRQLNQDLGKLGEDLLKEKAVANFLEALRGDVSMSPEKLRMVADVIRAFEGGAK